MSRRATQSPQPKSYVSPILAVVLRPIHAVFMKIYFRVTVRGAEFLPDEGPVILTPTHRSRWDTFLLYCAVKRRVLRFLTTRDEFTGLQAWFMNRLGAFPINTRRPAPSALRHCEEILLSGHALVIFPEGAILRLPPGEAHPIKPGAAWLALQVQRQLGETPLSIIPVRLNLGDRFLHFRSRAEVELRPPLIVKNYLGERPDKEAIRALTADIQTALGERVNADPPAVVEAIAKGEPPPSPPSETPLPDAAQTP